MIDFDYLATLDFSVPWEYRWQLLHGLWISFFLMLASSGAGLALGVVLAITSRTKHAVLRWMITAYVEFFLKHSHCLSSSYGSISSCPF